MVIGYVGVSTEAQAVRNQRYEILEYARRSGLKTISLRWRRAAERARPSAELFGRLTEGDTIIDI